MKRGGGASRKIRIRARRRKDTGEKRAECSTDGMNAECIKRVVIAKPGFEFRACKKRDDASSNPNHDRAARPDISATGRNDDQPRHGTRAKAEHTRFTAQRVLEHGPCERCNRGGKCSSRERVCRDSIRASALPALKP